MPSLEPEHNFVLYFSTLQHGYSSRSCRRRYLRKKFTLRFSLIDVLHWRDNIERIIPISKYFIHHLSKQAIQIIHILAIES